MMQFAEVTALGCLRIWSHPSHFFTRRQVALPCSFPMPNDHSFQNDKDDEKENYSILIW
jgi:hypothetical protein